MRDIKFRAWDGKAFLYSDSPNADFVFGGKGNGVYLSGELILDLAGGTTSQYTGLKDKNGVEIYEGDIIEEMMYVQWCDVQGGFQVHMSGYGGNDCMACGGDIIWGEVVEDSKRYEVIGNIYENPELLKGAV